MTSFSESSKLTLSGCLLVLGPLLLDLGLALGSVDSVPGSMITLASLGAGLVKSMKSASNSVKSIQDTFCGSASSSFRITRLLC